MRRLPAPHLAGLPSVIAGCGCATPAGETASPTDPERQAGLPEEPAAAAVTIADRYLRRP